MEKIKQYSKTLAINLACILILSLLTAIIHYFDLLSDKIIDSLLIVIPILTVFVFSYILGTNTDQKGWLNGIIYAMLFIVVTKIIEFIFLQTFITDFNYLYYLIITLTSIFGSMVGISKKQN